MSTIDLQTLPMAPASLAATNQKANSDLLEAVKAGDELKVFAALALPGVDVNCRDEGYNPRTPLLLACNPADGKTNGTVVQLLLEDSRVNVNARDTKEHTAMHSCNGKGELVTEILLSRRTDIDWNAADMIGQTPLLWFARMGEEESFRRLIYVESVNLFATTIDGFTALHQVAERKTPSPDWATPGGISNRLTIVYLLLEELGRRGRNVVSFVDATDILNRSALHYIAEEGCIEILEVLCKYSPNMNVNGVDFHGFTPLHLAVRNGHDAVVKRLLRLQRIDANVRATVNASNPDNLEPPEKPEVEIYRPNLFLKRPEEQPSCDLTPLHFAAMDGRMEVVRLLLEWEGINIDAVDSASLKPLHYSAQNGHWEVVELLLKKGKPFAATKQKANLDLLEAAIAGDELKVVAALAQPGVDVNCCDYEGHNCCTPLLVACNYTKLSVFRHLLEDSRVNVNARDIQRQTALHTCGDQGQLLEEMLLSKRTDIDWNAADRIGQTPLLWFARKGDEKSVRRLIGVKSVNLFATTIDVFTALHQVAERRTPLPAWMTAGDISNRCNIVDLVLEAVGRSRHKVVSFVDATDILNRSALHYIAEEGCIKIFELLCKFSPNMNVNGVDFHGFAPLHLAVRNGHDAVVQRLLRLHSIDANVRATVNASNPDKLKPFEEPQSLICRPNLFLKRPEEQPSCDLTPLHFAAMDGRMEVVRLLLEWEGINIDPVDSAGLTPLQYSVQNGHWEVVELLLKKGKPFATLNIDAVVGSASRTPLHFAVMNGRMEVVRLLLEWEGIKIDAVDSAGFTPLHYSVQNGHLEMVDLLLKKGKPFATLDYDRQRDVFKDLLRSATEREEKTIAIQLLNELGSRMKDFADISNKFSGDPSFGNQSRLLALAVVSNHFEIIKYIVKWQPEVNVNERSEWAAIPGLVATPLHFALVERDVATVGGPKRGHVKAVQELLEHPKLDVNAQDNENMTPLLYAIEARNVDIVKVLCQEDNFHRLRATEENSAGHTPLQIVVEANNRSEDPNMKAIEKVLLERSEVKDFVDRLYRDRQVVVDAANALLVGAALIASVTFAGWLQPPLGYTPYYDFSQPFPAPPGAYESYAAIKQNPKVKAFWVFNSLSFFFAIAAVVAGADAAMPSLDDAFIGRVVKSVRRSLIIASFLLVISVVCVLGAFASGGLAVLPPLLKYDTSMIITVCVGGTVCMIILAKFLLKLAKAFRTGVLNRPKEPKPAMSVEGGHCSPTCIGNES